MKIVTVCHGGNVRSVALKYLLKFKYNHETLSCGFAANSSDTREMLFEWADVIVVMTKEMTNGIPEKYKTKLLCYDVGEDVYGNPFHPVLQNGLDQMIQKHGFFIQKEVV